MLKKILIIFTILIGLFIVFSWKKSIKNDTSDVSVDDYYNKNATVLDKYDVQNSVNLQTEAEALNDISERGFSQNSISYDYMIDGKYVGAQEISDPDVAHPMYQTYYTSSTGEVWTIIVINGSIVAKPVLYNMNPDLDVQTIVSETKTIMGYDSQTNIFYETIPNPTELIVKIVDRIDTTTLDALTNEAISDL